MSLIVCPDQVLGCVSKQAPDDPESMDSARLLAFQLVAKTGQTHVIYYINDLGQWQLRGRVRAKITKRRRSQRRDRMDG